MRKTSKTIRRLGRAAARPLAGMGFSGPVEDMLTWDIKDRGGLVIVVVEGELDIHSAPGLGEALAPAADAGRHLIVDVADLRFCDCAGLSRFLRTQDSARTAGGSLHLAAPTVSMRRLLKVARMSDVLTVTGSVAEAIALLNLENPSGTPPRPLPRPRNHDDRHGREVS
ncbi:MAG TPA: STAS domain-containing protein [Streptosporangiaceae bacterium]